MTATALPLDMTTSPATLRQPEILRPYSDNAREQIDQVVEVIERFHDDEHTGPFRFCYERPCREVAGITRGNLL